MIKSPPPLKKKRWVKGGKGREKNKRRGKREFSQGVVDRSDRTGQDIMTRIEMTED